MKSSVTSEKEDIYLGGKSRDDVTHDGPLYKLSSNENLLGPSPLAASAMQKAIRQLHEYPDRTDKRLVEALVAHHKGALSKDQIITGNSGTALIQLICTVFLGPGTTCIYSDPSFAPYTLFAKRSGATAINVPLKNPDYQLDKEGILARVTPSTKLVWLCSPNNPTGTYIKRRELEWILEHLPNDVIVVYDEVYHHFARTDDYSRAIPYIDKGHNIIAINSFSKAYGLAGLRIGYAYGKHDLIQALRLQIRPFHLNTLALRAAEAALGDRDFIALTSSLIKDQKNRLYGIFDRLRVRFWPSEANFILIKPEMDAFAFESAMLERGIMVRPAEKFGAKGCVRVTIGTEEANTVFIAALEDIIDNTDLWKKKS